MRKIVLIALMLAGCQKVPLLPYLAPHKIDIQQGNYVSQEMIAKLKPGMTRSQVRFVLGTPLVVDVFRSDRWDYVYLYQKGGEVTEHRRISVIFNGDQLTRIDGDVVPAAAPGAAGSTPDAADKAQAGQIVSPVPTNPKQ
jgi:outer membrane protein assembly factor BamE